MEKAKVYFTDFRTVAFGDGLPVKLKKLIKEAGIGQIDMNGKFVAIKMHFGELGNVSFLRPNYAKAVADVVKELGGKPFLTDCNTMYPGSRKNALEHLECAWENGFSPLSVGCPILIGDGLKGTDDVEVPVAGGEYVKSAKIGRAVMDADIFISLTHFKGHEMTGFGGTIKNIGMGCGSRAGKKEQHSSGKPYIDPDLCRACMKCQKECANGGLVFHEESRKMTVNREHCVGCGRCLGACNFDAIAFDNDDANDLLNRRMAEYTKAVVDGRPNFHISLVMDVSPNCDCHGENDAPILPDLGMFASFDPLALDQACVDACLKAAPLPGSQLADNLSKKGFVDHHDHFVNSSPESEWRSCLEQAEKIGLGTRAYELISVLGSH
ncbi:MAG: 4Fe-4S ferredoxin iron-sulfur binding protein [Bacillota bacterium]|nr:4Fe-4S ferredoxin iron-sulfur binding protein [Bacillota bacterium]